MSVYFYKGASLVNYQVRLPDDAYLSELLEIRQQLDEDFRDVLMRSKPFTDLVVSFLRGNFSGTEEYETIRGTIAPMFPMLKNRALFALKQKERFVTNAHLFWNNEAIRVAIQNGIEEELCNASEMLHPFLDGLPELKSYAADVDRSIAEIKCFDLSHDGKLSVVISGKESVVVEDDE